MVLMSHILVEPYNNEPSSRLEQSDCRILLGLGVGGLESRPIRLQNFVGVGVWTDGLQSDFG